MAERARKSKTSSGKSKSNTTRRKTRKTAKTAKKKSSAKRRSSQTKRWSQRVTEQSDALDLDQGVFTWKNPKRIATSLKHSADASRRKKSDSYRSAMSMLTFYINRAGKGLSPKRRKVLEAAKDELREAFGRE